MKNSRGEVYTRVTFTPDSDLKRFGMTPPKPLAEVNTVMYMHGILQRFCINNLVLSNQVVLKCKCTKCDKMS